MGKTKFTVCVLKNFSSLLFPAERLSVSEEGKAIFDNAIGPGKEAMKEALCVSIKHIMVIIFRLRGSHLACMR